MTNENNDFDPSKMILDGDDFFKIIGTLYYNQQMLLKDNEKLKRENIALLKRVAEAQGADVPAENEAG